MLQNLGGHNFIRLLIESVNLPTIILVNVIYESSMYCGCILNHRFSILLRNYLVENVTSFTALFSLGWKNGKLYFYLCNLFLSKCFTQSLWQEGPVNYQHKTIYLFTKIEPSDCFISLNVLLNAKKRPHLWRQTANLKLRFAVCGWEKKLVAKGLY